MAKNGRHQIEFDDRDIKDLDRLQEKLRFRTRKALIDWMVGLASIMVDSSTKAEVVGLEFIEGRVNIIKYPFEKLGVK